VWSHRSGLARHAGSEYLPEFSIGQVFDVVKMAFIEDYSVIHFFKYLIVLITFLLSSDSLPDVGSIVLQ
jgi:hypothetical protein